MRRSRRTSNLPAPKPGLRPAPRPERGPARARALRCVLPALHYSPVRVSMAAPGRRRTVGSQSVAPLSPPPFGSAATAGMTSPDHPGRERPCVWAWRSDPPAVPSIPGRAAGQRPGRWPALPKDFAGIPRNLSRRRNCPVLVPALRPRRTPSTPQPSRPAASVYATRE